MEDLPLFAQPQSQPRPNPPAPAKAAAPAPAPPVAAPAPLSITELTQKIRGTLEPAFTQVLAVGEVSNYRPAASGHAYFSLKDGGSAISAACFGWGARRRNWELKDGLQVLVRGKVTVYPPRGSYQLTIDHIEPVGAGALQLEYEQLKGRLQSEGLFEATRKRPLPRYPRKIAVVTSSSGAAIQDMLNILKRRAPHMQVLVVPALVQGAGAADQVRRGLEAVNRLALAEVVVLARGGGSIEDLWAFNDEALARAIAASRLPVVSAVGHEIDFTIGDFVADLRAPTPSAAAEILSAGWVEGRSRLGELGQRLRASIVRDLQNRKALLRHIAARVISPKDRLREQSQRIDELSLRLERGVRVRLERRRALVEQSMAKLDALSPLRVLERGYAIVREGTGNAERLVRSAQQVRQGQELRIRFHDGEREVQAL